MLTGTLTLSKFTQMTADAGKTNIAFFCDYPTVAFLIAASLTIRLSVPAEIVICRASLTRIQPARVMGRIATSEVEMQEVFLFIRDVDRPAFLQFDLVH